MTVTTEKLPDESIIISTFTESTDTSANYSALLADLARIMDGLEGPVYRITDLSQIKIRFSDVVIALAGETKGKNPGTAADPRVRSVLVATGSLIELAAKSIQQDQYGKVHAPVLFTDREQALAYCRSELAKMNSR